MAKTKCPKCKGKGCSHCGGTGYHKMNKGGDMGKDERGYESPKERSTRGSS